ncbi:MAG: DUF2520 domain-containing protein [Flavobacteriaceae bacterium]|nr:DUF2520 domain-containing protein [Flavobacteriaceae bacterium]
MLNIVIIGCGNVAFHLINSFKEVKNINIKQVYSKSDRGSHFLGIPIVYNIVDIKEVDIYILAIKDSSVSEFSSKISFKNSLIVHTSGNLSIKDIKTDYRKGVFYPLQSISKENKSFSFENIPICIEAENKKDYDVLYRLGEYIGANVYSINSEQRSKMHLAAVFVNNFTNHIFKIGQDICDENDIPFEILHPLMDETINKVKKMSAKVSQTGPASRKDTVTIEKHIEQLSGNNKEIYKIITNSIINGEKL